jgi:hypothetical protein
LESDEIKYQNKPNIMKLKTVQIGLFSLIVFSGVALIVSCNSSNKLNDYKGIPYSDDQYKLGVQTIPGKLQCEYFDFGGEGITYHDSDSINSGSGGLNPADGSYLHEFRINEAVDISYTKFQDPPIDNTIFNLVQPEENQLYVGWTEPGEWIKYTINVAQSGTYQIGMMYTSNQNGKISIAVNDKDLTGPLLIPSTFIAADTVDWRQWHHWNYIDDLAKIDLKKGLKVLTLHTIEIGNMNYDYLNFQLTD